MPPYDLLLIMKNLPKPEIKEILKRTINQIKEHGGYVGPLEKIGEQRLPFRMKKDGARHTHGFYMFMETDIPAHQAGPLHKSLLRDRDIIKPAIIRKVVEEPRPCEKGECFFDELNNTELKLVKRWGRFKKLTV